ncbi:MAG: hypothetical protein P8Q92_00135 [Pseudoprimorskyibacter sp.]|nr:hypothetical protein [Pseudoprimorskyibacter sp.]
MHRRTKREKRLVLPVRVRPRSLAPRLTVASAQMGQYAIQSPLEEYAGFRAGHAFWTAIKQSDAEDLLYTGDGLCCGRL